MYLPGMTIREKGAAFAGSMEIIHILLNSQSKAECPANADSRRTLFYWMM